MTMEIWYHLPGGLTDPSMLLSDLIAEEERMLSDLARAALAHAETEDTDQ